MGSPDVFVVDYLEMYSTKLSLTLPTLIVTAVVRCVCPGSIVVWSCRMKVTYMIEMDTTSQRRKKDTSGKPMRRAFHCSVMGGDVIFVVGI